MTHGDSIKVKGRGFSLFSPFKSINANYLINEAFYKTKIRHQATNMRNLNMDRNVCVIKTVPYRARTDTQTAHGQHTDRQKVKTEGPMILSNDIFYFKTWLIYL